MRSQHLSPSFLWQSCAEPAAAWFLVWMPLVLLGLESEPSLGSAMVKLLAVLLVAGLIWARGLGPSGPAADRTFVAMWAGAWAGALGTLITVGSWQTSALGSAGLLATLFVGAGWLGWAYHERQQLSFATRSSGHSTAATRKPTTGRVIVTAWSLAAFVLLLLVWSRNAHWGDGIVLAVSLACLTAFQRGSLPAAESSG